MTPITEQVFVRGTVFFGEAGSMSSRCIRWMSMGRGNRDLPVSETDDITSDR
jgi:hypothetical protein